MNAPASMIRREWLEHKTGFGWAPIAVLGTLIVITLLVLMLARSATGVVNISSSDRSGDTLVESSEEFELQDRLFGMFDYSNWSDEDLADSIDKGRNSVALPFQLVYFLVAVFALLGSLHEDRRDRTVLFWKSMPVSDSETVFSKLIHIAWIAPAVTIAAILAAQIFLLLIVTIAGDGGVWRLWANSGLIMELIGLTIGYLVQGLWALPIYGWLLLVSTVATRVPFLWALLVPIVPIVLEPVIFSTAILGQGISDHMCFRALPSAPFCDEAGSEAAVDIGDQLGLLITADMWVGIVIGAGFIAAAIYMRRRNNEI